MVDIVAVTWVDGYRLQIAFADGVSGIVDRSEIVDFSGVFAPLRDLSTFHQVAANPATGTICWPNGADLDPDGLYARLTGGALPGA